MPTSMRLRLLPLFVLLVSRAAYADPLTDRADALLKDPSLAAARAALSSSEKQALEATLAAPHRRVKDQTLAELLRNPVAWNGGAGERALLGTIIQSLPAVAHIEGVEETVKLAAKPNLSLLRGHGTEIIAAAALSRFKTETGQQANVTRICGDVRCADGRLRESDGAALIGADGVPREVTVKSISTPNAISRSLKKATEQLALRNLQRDGSRKAGVLVVGYDDPAVLEQLKGKDWRAAATRSGAKLLVLAVNHRTGQSEKLAASEPDPNSSVKPKALPLGSVPGARLQRAVMRVIGRISPQAAAQVARWRHAVQDRWHAMRGSLLGARAR